MCASFLHNFRRVACTMGHVFSQVPSDCLNFLPLVLPAHHLIVSLLFFKCARYSSLLWRESE